MSRRLRVALLEPFFGGSHRASAEGWARHSRHAVELVTLPARFWKWRMRGAAFEFARRLHAPVERGEVDVVFSTSLVDLAHLSALLPRRVPSVLYFHENQVSYPPRPEGGAAERDLQYAFTNLASALAADLVAFNSAFQRESFLAALETLLGRMPDARPTWAVDVLGRRSAVLSLGVELSDVGPPARRAPGEPPLVLWNHRWEYDKGPDEFFGVLENLARRGLAFRVAVAGERYAKAPAVFARARDRLGERLVHWGTVARRDEYVELLSRSHFVVSTAVQENFGLSVVEATGAGAHPLVPDRLSYPEVLPPALHGACLYSEADPLEEKLGRLLSGETAPLPPGLLRDAVRPHAWENRAPAFDETIFRVFEGNLTRGVL